MMMSRSDRMTGPLRQFVDLPWTLDSVGDAWLSLSDDVKILASIDPSGSFLHLVVPLGILRCHADEALAMELLRRNGRHQDAAHPCFSIDARDDTVVISSSMELHGLTPDEASTALNELDAAVREARSWLADALQLSTSH